MDIIKSIENFYSNIRQHKTSDTFSPHKPLTLIFALSNIYKNKRFIEYNLEREKLEEIITEITKRKSNCLYPMTRLLNDNETSAIWEIHPTNLPKNSSGDISIKDAKENNFKAGFSDEIFNFLKNNQETLQRFIHDILEDNFPETLWGDLISIFEIDNLPLSNINEKSELIKIKKRYRDPDFPKKILALYDHRCAFCQLKIFYKSKPTSIEAAHIKWNAYGGECSEDNGIALCPTHHLTLDKGIWTLNNNFEIVLSPFALVDENIDFHFKPFIGKSILNNIMNKALKPKEENVHWHRQNIFDK